MPAVPHTKDEAGRLRALATYQLYDDFQDEALDSLVCAAAGVCESDIAIVSVIEKHRQLFLSTWGHLHFRETPRRVALCAHAIAHPEGMVLEDVKADPRFAEYPMVNGAPYARFYAGTPLLNRDGFALGTLCVMDPKTKQISRSQVEFLRVLAGLAVRMLDARLK